MPTPVKVLLIGCGVVLVLAIGGCFVFLAYFGGQQSGGRIEDDIELSVDAPGRVAAGESFEIVARARNIGRRERELVDLDIADQYLEGIVITGTEPDHTDSMHVPLDNTVSYSFGLPIPPGGEAVVVFQAYAAHPGDWAGDFDFCIDSEFDFVSEHVRTLVTSAP